ncbi:MAG: amidophosphoribosyltransferase, partial [Deltaproteobacteria bacterium]|nr:amidophosphoribosyltransferase [Deltaproteobacteria bacterium]
YSTVGDSGAKNCQPILVDYYRGSLAVAHNGNLVNSQELREELGREGLIFSTTTDTEVIIHLLARDREDSLLERLRNVAKKIKGAYCLLLMTDKQLLAVRDPNGFHPLVLGRLGSSYVVSSETCALDFIEARFLREVAPGEIVQIDETGLHSFELQPSAPSPCVFEYVYFARPDSDVFGRQVYTVRRELGRQLARECPVEADVVVPVPDSGTVAAIGFAEESGIPFHMGLTRNHYVGRTFIEPTQSIRSFGVKLKLNPVRDVIAGKRVVLVDDSIVRGTTSYKIVKMIRDAGAKEVHMRISSPPTSFPCFYGVDTPDRKELISSSHSVEEINRCIGSDTLGYLSREGMLKACCLQDGCAFCDACFSGDYPVKFPRLESRLQLNLFE